MKLTIETVTVKDIVLDKKSYLENGNLHLNLEELEEMGADARFASLKVEIARPGESCRISWVGDVIQPRIKTDSPDDTFPGVLGNMKRAGSGRTTALEGVAVVEVWGMQAPMALILDMSGVGAEYSPFSETLNVVVVAEPAPMVDNIEYARALKNASLTIGKYLASLAVGLPPDKEEVYELDSEPQVLKDADGNELPRFVYIFQVFSTNALVEPLYYGDNCRGMLPTPVHPNEILDGALLYQNYDQILNGESSYVFCNHPVIKELYDRHGKDINFAGVILKIAPFEQTSKERFAMIAATQAKYNYNADGVILTKEGGGHPMLDMALTCEQCEELGIKTVLMITEFITIGGGRNDTLIFNTEKADAIVSSGIAVEVEYPSVDRLIGRHNIPGTTDDMQGAFTDSCRQIRGSVSQVGNTYMMSVEQ